MQKFSETPIKNEKKTDTFPLDFNGIGGCHSDGCLHRHLERMDRYMPDMEELENPISRSASMIYSADGKLMGTYNSDRENRIIVDTTSCRPTWCELW